jgi:hypothetical protein
MESFLLENQPELCERLLHTMGHGQNLKVIAIKNWETVITREPLTMTGEGITTAKMTIWCIIGDEEKDDWAKTMNETLAKLPSKDKHGSYCYCPTCQPGFYKTNITFRPSNI